MGSILVVHPHLCVRNISYKVGYPFLFPCLLGVTHDFGHLGDVLTMVYSGSQQEHFP
jgi:hypothetical protein